MMSKIVLNDVFKDWLTHGIISHLTLNFNVPWKNSVDGSILDLEYHGNRSGNKIISPLVEKLITKDGISLSNISDRFTIRGGELETKQVDIAFNTVNAGSIIFEENSIKFMVGDKSATLQLS